MAATKFLHFFSVLLLAAVLQDSAPSYAQSGDQNYETRTSDSYLDLEKLSESAYKRGEYREALEASKSLLNRVRRRSGAKSPEYVAALNIHVRNLLALDQVDDAESLVKSSNELSNGEALMPWDLEALRARQLYAEVLFYQGKYIEANYQLHQAGISASHSYLIKQIGEDHPSIVRNAEIGALFALKSGMVEGSAETLRTATDRYRSVLGASDPRYLDAMSLYVQALQSAYKLEEAETVGRVALEQARISLGNTHPTTLWILGQLGSVLLTSGRYEVAAPLLEEAQQGLRDRLGSEHTLSLSALSNYAMALLQSGNVLEAENYFEEALSLTKEKRGEFHPDTSYATLSYATALMLRGRPDDALPLLELVIPRFRGTLGWGHPDILRASAIYGLALSATGQPDRAISELSVAHRLMQEDLGAHHPDTIAVAMWLSMQFVGNRQFGGFPYYDWRAFGPALLAANGMRERRRIVQASIRAESSGLLRGVEQELFWHNLANASWQAAKVANQIPDGVFDGDVWPQLEPGASRERLFVLEAFRALQDSLVRPTSRAMAENAVRALVEQRAGIGSLVDERRALLNQWAQAENTIVSNLGSDTAAAAENRSALRDRSEELVQEILEIDEQLKEVAPEYISFVNQEPLDVNQAMALLEPHEAVLMLVPTVHGTHVMALTDEDLRWIRSDLTSDELAVEVSNIRFSLDPYGTVRSDDLSGSAAVELGDEPDELMPFDRLAAHGLYVALVEPLESLLQGRSEIYVAAGGAIASLPLHVLVTKEPAGDDTDAEALRGTAWLGDQFAFVQIPSLQSFMLMRQVEGFDRSIAGTGRRSFAGFGDPVLEGDPTARGSTGNRFVARDQDIFSEDRPSTAAPVADVSKLKRLARLPGTARELIALRTALGAPENSVRLRHRATESAVRDADLSDTRIIAFATHGLLAGEAGGVSEPGLVFTPPQIGTETDDGLLTASEVAGMSLSADWIILSACNTAVSENSAVDGLSSLSRSFFYAGARSLLATHWPVDDEMAVILTTTTISLLNKDDKISRARALQKAMQIARNEISDPNAAHPASWAPFIIIGDGR